MAMTPHSRSGLSPERLWGLVAIAVAVAYGLAWLVAIVRGWKGGGWRDRLRRANLNLAVLISGVALFLALPILDFGAISARQQLGRLESGKVSAKEFDYEALRWDFGDAGRRALARLEKSGNSQVADYARLAAAQTERTWRSLEQGPFAEPDEINVRLQPEDAALRAKVVDYLRANRWQCGEYCVAIDLGQAPDGAREIALVTGGSYQRVRLPQAGAGTRAPEVTPASAPLTPKSTVEIRTIERRYITIDGKPVGDPLDDALEGSPPPR